MNNDDKMDGAVEAARPAENGEVDASHHSDSGTGAAAAAAAAGGASSTLRSLCPRAHFERYRALYRAGLECDLALTCAADAQSVRCHAAVVAAAFPVFGQGRGSIDFLHPKNHFSTVKSVAS